MKTHCRCRSCKHRTKLKHHPLWYIRQPRCKVCGARSWQKDEYRHWVELEQIRTHTGRYKLCYTCFHYPHRMASRGCVYHIDGTYRELGDPMLQLPGSFVI